MALSIKSAEADRLARELADITGETLTEAIVNALRERLVRESYRAPNVGLLEEMRRIRERLAQLPILDDRTPDEIIGYDDNGLPG